ncbi:MAG: metalloregulator ArsR/SmtB family transcription factor [Clostridia bacterium]|nr:metalloregulator ArsR/SmtB family transcription factor [Clostridia bacterium]
MSNTIKNQICDEEEVHKARVKSALGNMPSEENIAELSERFKALSEASRLKILFALSGGELCVEHITEAVNGLQSAVSHQLKTLRLNKIVKCRREGKKVLYSVSDDHVITMINVAKEHLNCDE